MSEFIKFAFDLADRIASVFPHGSVLYQFALAIAVGLIMGGVLAATLLLLSAVFQRIYKFASGRDFVFTQKIALRISRTLAILFSLAVIYHTLEAILTGQTVTTELPRGSSSHVIYWQDSHFEFSWNLIRLIIFTFGIWLSFRTIVLKIADGTLFRDR